MLTPKQEAFCTEFIACGNASEAYRKVYDCARMKPETVNRAAHALTNNYKITARLEELRSKAAKAAIVTLAGHLEDLKRLRDKAEMAEEYAAAISAEVSRGKAAGLYESKLRVVGSIAIDKEQRDAAVRAALMEAGNGRG